MINLQPLKLLDRIRVLYNMPRSHERFRKYLAMLQGPEGGEMILPIAGFNPMGRGLAVQKLDRLIEWDAEGILADVISCFNENQDWLPDVERTISVAINLTDDVEGSWSNYFSTDYTNKFDFGHLLKRDFCTPVFFTSEELTKSLITCRIAESTARSICWLVNGRPETLGERLEQEVQVQMHLVELSNSPGSGQIQGNCFFQGPLEPPESVNIQKLEAFAQAHAGSDDYALNSNFFYGDPAAENLNLRKYGLPPNGGFKYARYLACNRGIDNNFKP